MEWMSTIGMLVVMLAIFYFLLIRPENKKKKELAKMRSELTIGDEVTTIGGVIGRVTAIKEDTFVLETGSDRVKIRFRRSAIASVEKLDMGTGKDSKDAKDSAKK